MRKPLPDQIPALPVATNLLAARRAERSSPADLERLQAAKLRHLVRHAVRHVPFYRERISDAESFLIDGPDDLHRLPTIHRSDLHTGGVGRFAADGYDETNTRAATTSGSTGMPLTLLYSEEDLSYLRATFLWDMLAAGMRPWDKVGYFRGGAFRRHRLERFGLARNVLINARGSVAEQTDAFLRGRPNFLYGFPTAILTVAEELERRGIRPRWVHGVIFAGEKMTQDARRYALDYFDARGTDVYASVESYTIGRDCSHGAMHLRSGDVVVEVEHADGSISLADGIGQILVTRLHSKAMPLIRYRLGDRVVIEPDDCPCTEFSTPIIRSLEGRVMDRLITRSGRIRSSDFLIHATKDFTQIRKLQFVQRRPGELTVRFVADDPARNPALADRLGRLMDPHRAELEISIEPVADLHPEKNGKIRLMKVEHDQL